MKEDHSSEKWVNSGKTALYPQDSGEKDVQDALRKPGKRRKLEKNNRIFLLSAHLYDIL